MAFYAEAGCSQFRMRYIRGEFPFTYDHSGAIFERRISWQREFQEIQMHLLLPQIIEGFSEVDPLYSRIQSKILEDIIKHCDPQLVNKAIKYCVVPLVDALKLDNPTIVMSVAQFLNLWVSNVPNAVSSFIPYLYKILSPFNKYFMKEVPLRGEIFYGQKRKPLLSDYIEELLRLIEQNACNSAHEAYMAIKQAIPTYESMYFTGIRVIGISHLPN